MTAYISLLIFTALISGGIIALVKRPRLRGYLPLLQWGLRTVRTSLDYWGFRRSYTKEVGFLVRYLDLLWVMGVDNTDLRKARKRVAAFVADSYNYMFPPGIERDRAADVATAGYMAVLSFPEIKETVYGLQFHKELDVQKATYVVIDILGELFDLEDELSREYFQHLVYGLNKCLLIFKKGGKSRSALKEIYATLWRIYQLTKAYNKLKASEGLSKKEFYEKITFILDSMFRVLGE